MQTQKRQLDELLHSFLSLNTPLLPGQQFPLVFPFSPPPLLESVPLDNCESSEDWTSPEPQSQISSDSEHSSPKRKASSDSDATPKKPKFEGDKQERRRMQNRQAAATARIKKKNSQRDLEARVQFLTEMNAQLQQQVTTLMETNLRLQAKFNPSSNSRLATFESAELSLPQQSEVTRRALKTVDLAQAMAWLILGLLCIVLRVQKGPLAMLSQQRHEKQAMSSLVMTALTLDFLDRTPLEYVPIT